MSHLKKTIITPFEPRYSNRPDGAVCYKRKKALDVWYRERHGCN